MIREESVTVHLQPQPVLRQLHYAVHVVAAVVVLGYPTILPVKLAAIIFLIIGSVLTYRVFRRQSAVEKLRLSRQQSAIWFDNGRSGDGKKKTCKLVGNAFVSRFLVIVSLRLTERSGKKIHLILTPDSAVAEELRKLRVYLLTGKED